MKIRVKPSGSVVTDRILVALAWLCGVVSLSLLLSVVGYVFVRGLAVIDLDFLVEYPRQMGKEGGILPTIVGTLSVTILAMLLVLPLGVGTAIYLAEYAPQNWGTRSLQVGVDLLAGIPSVIFGLFGFVFFVITLRLGWSVFSGGLTLAFMILPIVARISEEAIRAVSTEYREAALTDGASRWQMVRAISIPLASPGIMTGLVLGIGRAFGETAAVMLTVGGAVKIPTSLFDSARPMSLHLYLLAYEGISLQNAFGTALMLIFIVLLTDIIALWTIRERKRMSTVLH